VGRLLGWYMRVADAAASTLAPHRYDIPLDAPAGDDGAPLAFTGADDALAWYDSERANIVAATRQAAAHGLHEIAWRLPAPLFGLFNSRGNWTDLIATHRIALESARQAGNRPGEAWILNTLGEALGITGDTEAIRFLEQSLEIRREIGDSRGEAQAANNLADAYERLGRTEEAVDLLCRALELNREVGYRFGEGIAMGNLGSTLLDLGRAEEAIDCLLQARSVFTETDYEYGVGYVLHTLGRCYMSLRRDAEALDYLQQALASHRATGNRPRQAATMKSLGTVQSRLGLTAQARESWAQAAAIFDDLGDSAQAELARAEQAGSGNLRECRLLLMLCPTRCCAFSVAIFLAPGGPANERTSMGNAAIAELVDAGELDELYKLDATETEPEDEDEDEDLGEEDDEGGEGISPRDIPHP
jgi:tetratricopeptide (TPR) repeat protein